MFFEKIGYSHSNTSQGFDSLEYVLKFHIELMEYLSINVLESQVTANEREIAGSI